MAPTSPRRTCRRCREKWGLTPLIDAEAVEAVAQRSEGDAEELGGGGFVEARRLERLHDRLALELVEEVVQRQAAGAERAVELRRLVLVVAVGEVEVGRRDPVLGAERQRPLEDVLQLAHVAGE